MIVVQLLNIIRNSISYSNRSWNPKPPTTIPRDDHHMAGLFCSHPVDIRIVLPFKDAYGALTFDNVDNNCNRILWRINSGRLRKVSPRYRIAIIATFLGKTQYFMSFPVSSFLSLNMYFLDFLQEIIIGRGFHPDFCNIFTHNWSLYHPAEQCWNFR